MVGELALYRERVGVSIDTFVLQNDIISRSIKQLSQWPYKTMMLLHFILAMILEKR